MKEIIREDEEGNNPLHLKSLNHVSLVCRSVEESMAFYQNVLGFVPIRRPGSFDFFGAWLFGHGVGIHLLQSEDPENLPQKSQVINPKANHISFQCESMGAVEKKLKEIGLSYIRQRVEEGGIFVDQLFFHDPDGFMIEICDCENLPVVPLAGEAVCFGSAALVSASKLFNGGSGSDGGGSSSSATTSSTSSCNLCFNGERPRQIYI